MGDIHHLPSKEICVLTDIRALLINLCKMQAYHLMLAAKEHVSYTVPEVATASVKLAKQVEEYLSKFEHDDANTVCKPAD